jgi:tRNA-Thr(GGU) m(6)t(6)A37 methyltransferase TsaA
MPDIHLRPVAWVHNNRRAIEDDFWGGLVSEIRLEAYFPEESLDGIEAFSHVEIVFHFHLAREEKVVSGTRRPRGDPQRPLAGIFAQRNKDRPNHLGLTPVRVLRREGRSLFVEDLDAVDGTPVLDIKPVMQEYLPRGPLRQPDWSHEMLKNYWSPKEAGK